FSKRSEEPRQQRIELIHQRIEPEAPSQAPPIAPKPRPLEINATPTPSIMNSEEKAAETPVQETKPAERKVSIDQKAIKEEKKVEEVDVVLAKSKIEDDSAAALERSAEDKEEEDKFHYTTDKVKRKYGDLPGEPTILRLVGIPPKGLGLSLAGRSENEKQSVFVVDIKSTSPLPLQVGDELLEVSFEGNCIHSIAYFKNLNFKASM
uniref:PDZ domain-containing protein n=1 Tax=Bursaphelenchus xylophilus TaxID=6326 RepID=A0A1I7SJK3_BURXY